MDDALTPAHHHRLLIDQLHRVESGELTRLMVFWPPGHAKSKYSSEYGPAWYIGRNKRKTIIHAAYGADFAERFGRKIRNHLVRPEYEAVFGVTLSPDSRSAGEWETSEGGEYKAAGVGSGITGRRADLGLIDDPVKGRKEADSPTYRESTWDWYLADFRTRLKPGAAIVIIQTRWHEDDLSGRILPKDYDGRSGWVTARDGEQWYVLNFPAICEREDDGTGRLIGEALWPGYITHESLLQTKLTQGSRNWSALYQQRPAPGDGGIFKSAWVRRYGIAPSEGMIVQSWDTAYKPGEINDPSCCTTWLATRQGHYLLDVFCDRLDYPALKRTAHSLFLKWRPHSVLIEDKASGQSLIQELRSSRETSMVPVIPITPDGDKLTRANAVSPQFEAGLVFLPHAAPWLIDYEGELFGFPLSTHDDRVDSTSQYLTWIRSHSVSLSAVGSGNARAGVSSYDEPASQIDETRGFGTVRGGTNLHGF